MASGDFNRDGVPDYAVANYEGSVSVLFGTPGGGFTASPRIATGAGTIGVLANDFDRDGRTDIVGMSGRRADVTVALGTRTGTFLPPIRYRVGGSPWEIAAADLNRDGNLDILATTGLPDELHVLFGTGTGVFLPPRIFAAGDMPTGIATGDFNADGQLDVVRASFGGDFLTVMHPCASSPSSGARRSHRRGGCSCRASAALDAFAPPTRRKLSAGVS
jgi:FG-GAP-like repeat